MKSLKDFKTKQTTTLSLHASGRIFMFNWKCHRRLLCDFLVVHGVEVVHILGQGKMHPHKLKPGTVATGQGLIKYPGPVGGS